MKELNTRIKSNDRNNKGEPKSLHAEILSQRTFNPDLRAKRSNKKPPIGKR